MGGGGSHIGGPIVGGGSHFGGRGPIVGGAPIFGRGLQGVIGRGGVTGERSLKVAGRRSWKVTGGGVTR